MNPWLRRLSISIASILIVAGLGLLAAKGFLSRSKPAEGQPPKGYASQTEMKAAFALGELKLIDRTNALPEGVVERTDIEYGTGGGRPLKLDLYASSRLSRPAPALLFIHGGGWKSGKRQDYRVYTTYFASLGYVTASMSYRLVPQATFPAAVQDAKCAVRWLRANAAKYQIDPDRIAVVGGSAGGHLSLMVGYSPADPDLEGEGGNPTVSSRVSAVVNFYGPVDLTTPFATSSGLVKAFLGKSFEADPSIYRRASPLFYLNSNAPPTLTFHGTLDDIVPIDQADSLEAGLKKAGVSHEYARIEGWPHTLDLARDMNDFCKERMTAFLRKYLGPPGSLSGSK